MIDNPIEVRVAIVSLGCPKNSVDSGIMETLLAERGYKVVDDGYMDVVIINTCGFIETAKEESIDEILRFTSLKGKGLVGKVLVGGCLSQRYMKELGEEIPEVDRYFSLDDVGKVDRIVTEVLETQDWLQPLPTSSLEVEFLYKRRAAQIKGPWAYLKISDGCPHFCSFCVIPQIRGPLKSRVRKDVLSEFREMVKRGAKEVNLVGQDIASYGSERGEKDALPDLLKSLSEISEGELWIRLLYLHPLNITENLIRAVKESPFVVNYFDVPIQHGSSRMLGKMKRNYTRDYLRDLFSLIREEMEDAVLRTTVLLGFPGENDDDFNELMELIDEVRFDRVGGFVYSREEGSVSFRMENQVPRGIATARIEELMTLQSRISHEINSSLLGKRFTVLAETGISDEGIFKGRYYGQAPEVDGFVSARSRGVVNPGDRLTVKITDYDHYDLFGDVVE